AAARRASVASQTSRTTCTLRFLRAVRVQTGCANNAWWIGSKSILFFARRINYFLKIIDLINDY
ncbi:hypothetical protein CTQ55_19970, partial [Salmonella enterica subsp. enterica serovar Adjame]|nr:hypothetical protein [Salmonella enterica subsp. enterica serovar Adjame]